MGDSTDQDVQAPVAPVRPWAGEADKRSNRELLMEIARMVVGKLDSANEVIDLAFLAEGGFNHVWVVTFVKNRNESPLGNGQTSCEPSRLSRSKLILRVPSHSHSLHPYQLRNEVGFLAYVAQKLSNVPAPKVYAFEDGLKPDTILPYIAEEYIEGQRLEDVWHKLSDEEKESLCQQIARIAIDLAEARFLAIGSLTTLDGSQLGPIISGGKIFKGRYKFHSPKCYHIGPYASAKEYVLAAYDREIYYYTHGGEDIEMAFFTRTSLPEWVEYLKNERSQIAAGDTYRDLLEAIDTQPIGISHGDLNTSNILVRDSRVVGVIDWEFAGTYPLSNILGPMDIISLSEEFYKADPDAAQVEDLKWNKRVLEVIEAVARERGWPDQDVMAFVGGSPEILSKAGFEMFPRDWMNEGNPDSQ